MTAPLDLAGIKANALEARARAAPGEQPWDCSGCSAYLDEVEALVAEVERLRADLADRDLALAMARGEGWPEGWERHGMTWWSPDGQARIYYGERFVPGGTEPTWTLERGSRIVATHHPDALNALNALRAHQAKATP